MRNNLTRTTFNRLSCYTSR